MNDTIPKVPIGPTTILGSSVSIAAFGLAVVAYLTGDHSQQTVGTIVAGAVSLGALAITAAVRGKQAQVLAHKAIAVYDGLSPVAQAEIESLRQRVDDAVAELQARDLGGVEPGDPLPALPHIPTKSPTAVPKDKGDAGE